MKLSKNGLSASGEIYHTLFETIPQGVVFQDANGKIIFANPAAQHILGLSLDSMQGHTSLDPLWQAIREDGKIYPGEDHPIAIARREGKPVMGVIMGMRHLNTGKIHWLKVDAIPLYLSGAATPDQVYAIFDDITELKEIEAALQILASEKAQTSARDEAILNSLPTGVIVTDMRNSLVSMNQAALELLGFTSFEQAAKYQAESGDMMDSRDPAGLAISPDAKPITHILKGEIISGFELQTRNHTTGEYRHGMIWGRQAQNAHGAPILAVMILRDTHILYLAHRELESIFTALPDGIIIYAPGGTIARVNPALESIFMAFPNPLHLPIEKRMAHFEVKTLDGHPIDREELPANRALRGETVSNLVVEVTEPGGGSTSWLSISATPLPDAAGTGAVAALTDISERIQLEKALLAASNELENRVQERTADLLTSYQALADANSALKENEERFRQMAENIREIFFMLTIDHGKILYISPAYEELTGVPVQRLYENARALLDCVHPDDLPTVMEVFRQSSQIGYDIQYRINHPHGGLRWVRTRTFPIFNEQGRVYRLAGIIEDITERILSYHTLEKRVAERTQELSTLLAISNNLSFTLELDELVESMLDLLSNIVPHTGVMVLLLHDVEFDVVAFHSTSNESIPLHTRFPLNFSDNPLRLVTTRQPLLLNTLDNESTRSALIREDSFLTSAGDANPVRSWLGVPMVVKDQVVGILRLTHTLPAPFNQGHVQLVQAIAIQAGIAIENARLYGQARELAVLNERQRLARELHDSVSQALYGISLGAHVALASLTQDPRKQKEALEYILSLADTGLTEMRALIFELRPDTLAVDGLLLALQRQTAALQARRGIEVVTQFGVEPDLPIETKEIVYRITQEALNNAAKHANPSRIDVKINDQPIEFVVEIIDNGKGFDPALPKPGHLGLRSMRERVESINGSLTINSAPGHGTQNVVKIPRKYRKTL